jgi:hypothetical protein
MQQEDEMAKKAIYNPITMQWETEDELKSKPASSADPVMSAMNRAAQPGGMVPQRAPLFPQDLAAAEKAYPAVQYGEPMPIPFAEGPTPLQAAITGANNRPAPRETMNPVIRAMGTVNNMDQVREIGRETAARENLNADLANPNLRVVKRMAGRPAGMAPWAAWATLPEAATPPQQPQGVPGMPPPYPSREIPTPEQVRAAMGRSQPAPAVAAAAMPAGAGSDAQDPMRGIPARDRLALQMWGGSNDTTRQAIDRFNSVARKYGMPLKERPRDARAREALAASGRLWTPGSRGGAVNTMTGEDTTPAAPAEQIDWNKRIVKQADGTYLDVETGRPFGVKAPQEHDWTVTPDGRRLDRKSPTGAVVGLPQVPQGAERFMNLGEKTVFDMALGRFVNGDGTIDSKKDKYQGQIVKIPTGGDSFMVGVFDKKNRVYEWKPNVKKGGGSIPLNNGTILNLGGADGLDLSQVPEFKDPDMQQPDPAAGKTATAPAGAAAGTGLDAPVGYIHTYPSGRKMMKNKDGKWVPV